MKFFYLFFATLFSASTILAQNSPSETTYHYPRGTLTKIGTASWGAGGAGIVSPLDATAGFNNPALRSSYQYPFYVEIGKRLPTEGALDTDTRLDKQKLLPAYLAISRSTEKYGISLAYARFYSYRELTVKEIPVFNSFSQEVENSAWLHELDVSSLSLACAFSLKPSLELGASAGINYLAYNEFTNVSRPSDGHGFGYQLAIGAIYFPNEKLRFAILFKTISAIKFEGSEDYLRIQNSVPVDTSSLFAVVTSYESMLGFPQVLSASLSYNLTHKWIFLFQVDFEKWIGVADGFENIAQFHSGMSYDLSSRITVMAGYFTQNDPSKISGDYYDQNFFTAGLNLDLSKKYTLSLSVIDSNLLSNKQPDETKDLFRQTYISVAIAFHL
ncbi:MAG: hypothetical protein DWQ05_16195 [Calditrichaeota bacterium]|nr:MAG: hypothetical protein DWQ05_16195 [Calditrichota bacterium]